MQERRFDGFPPGCHYGKRSHFLQFETHFHVVLMRKKLWETYNGAEIAIKYIVRYDFILFFLVALALQSDLSEYFLII